MSSPPPASPVRPAGPLAVAAPLTLAMFACVLSGCDDQRFGEGSAYTVSDSAGVSIVESVAPVWGDALIQADPEPLVHVGSAAEGPAQFAFVGIGLLLPDGGFAVAENAVGEIRVFDADGAHVRTLGGSGSGPGEFQSLTALFSYRGDSIGAYDQRLRRATLFSLADGGHRSLPNEVQGNYTAFGALADGRILLYSPGGGFRPDLEPGLQWVPTEVLALAPDGAADTLANLPSRQQLVLEGGDTEQVIPAYYATQGVAEDGFYWATQDRWEIRFFDGEGLLRRVQRRPVEPAPVTQAMVDAWIEANLERVRRFEGEARVPAYRARFEAARHNERVPAFGRAWVDADQRLWISEPSWPRLSPTLRRWSLFSPAGAWLGDVELPEGTQPLDAAGDRVLAVWRDALDVPHVRVHRLPVGETGGA